MISDLVVCDETSFVIEQEAEQDACAREALLDRVMGPGRWRKSSERLRRGQLPAAGLAFVARDTVGRLIGSVRLWSIAVGCKPMLLLGPLAVEVAFARKGVGSALMRFAIARATESGHGAIILVGDACYYQRFGFFAAPAAGLMMPGPVERHRLLGLELQPDYLAGSTGLIVAAAAPYSPNDVKPDALSLIRAA